MTELRKPLAGRRLKRESFARGRRALTALALLGLWSGPASAEPPHAPPGEDRATVGAAHPTAKKTQTKNPTPPSNAAPPHAQPEKKPLPKAAPVVRTPPHPAQRVVIPPPDLSMPPPELPAAPREKMRACADEWTQFKAAHSDPLPMWRDFAVKCLTR
ncbi:MAG TPA: hypothetical protein VEH76_03965 [Methylocystis sp.]|nr:hypothetical protein [Methylocystis sp.]